MRWVARLVASLYLTELCPADTPLYFGARVRTAGPLYVQPVSSPGPETIFVLLMMQSVQNPRCCSCVKYSGCCNALCKLYHSRKIHHKLTEYQSCFCYNRPKVGKLRQLEQKKRGASSFRAGLKDARPLGLDDSSYAFNISSCTNRQLDLVDAHCVFCGIETSNRVHG